MIAMILKFLSILFIISSSITSFELQCQFRLSGWWDGPLFYECEDTVSSILTKEDRIITGLKGNHTGGRSNANVVSFYAYRRTIRYFPKGLENYFQNLEYLGIVNELLQEITQEDLRPFNNLRVLYLDSNEIEVLDENLFQFNPKLEVLNINNNHIKFVDASVFKTLWKLKYLWFEKNFCCTGKVSNDTRSVRKLANEIIDSCYVQNVLGDLKKFQENEIRELRMEIEDLRTENLKLRNEILELKIEDAKCSILKEFSEKVEKKADAIKL